MATAPDSLWLGPVVGPCAVSIHHGDMLTGCEVKRETRGEVRIKVRVLHRTPHFVVIERTSRSSMATERLLPQQ